MKALVLYGPNRFKLENSWPVPEVREDWALVKVAYCGVCGSDLPRFFKTGSYHTPMILGHEFSGVIEKAAPEGTMPVGTPVAVLPIIPCNTCQQCIETGDPFQCSQYQFIGSRNDGGFAEYCIVKEKNLLPLNSKNDLLKGAFIEPLSVGLHAVRRSGISNRSKGSAIVFGSGPIGLSIAFWLDLFEIDVSIADIRDFSLNIAREIGIKKVCHFDQTEHSTAEYIFEASGAPSALSRAVEIAKPKGTITIVGRNDNDTIIPQKLLERLMRRELTLQGCWGYNLYGEKEVLLNGIKRFDANKIVSHLVKPDKIVETLYAMYEKRIEYCKVLMDFSEEIL